MNNPKNSKTSKTILKDENLETKGDYTPFFVNTNIFPATSVYGKLNHIQTTLKSPKSLNNTFFNFKYRSCETILENLKPLLLQTKTNILLSDEIVLINNCLFVKSTATLINCEEPFDKIETIAYAEFDEKSNKMSRSQQTGACSSYARKYALNGLFAIDDNKDADFINDPNNNDTTVPFKQTHQTKVQFFDKATPTTLVEDKLETRTVKQIFDSILNELVKNNPNADEKQIRNKIIKELKTDHRIQLDIKNIVNLTDEEIKQHIKNIDAQIVQLSNE